MLQCKKSILNSCRSKSQWTTVGSLHMCWMKDNWCTFMGVTTPLVLELQSSYKIPEMLKNMVKLIIRSFAQAPAELCGHPGKTWLSRIWCAIMESVFCHYTVRYMYVCACMCYTLVTTCLRVRSSWYEYTSFEIAQAMPGYAQVCPGLQTPTPDHAM